VLDSGGLREELIDLAEERRVPLAELTPATVARLRSFLPAGLEPVNPLDAAGPLNEGFADIFMQGIDALAEDQHTAAVFLEVHADDRFVYMPPLIEKAKAMPRACGKPFALISSFSTMANHKLGAELAEAGVPLINGVASALAAASAAFAFRDRQAVPREAAAEAPADAVRHWRKRLATGEPLDEVEGLALAEAFGVPTVAARVAETREAALAAAEAIGFPVALKTAMPGLDHKSDADGVRLGLTAAEAVADAWDDVAGRLGPRVAVARMAPPGVELAFGMVRDPQFGPVVMASAGGVLVELLEDRVFALPPFGTEEAGRLIGRLRASRLLAGVRGHAPADLDAVARALAAFSALAAALGRDAVVEIDLNPVICGPAGAVAVDALVVPG